MYGMRNPKEARKMVSNLSETLKKAYDDAVIAGKIEVAQNMLAKDMDEKLISEVSGLPMEQINTLKKNIKATLRKQKTLTL
jgi:phospholipid N-methyltransferase